MSPWIQHVKFFAKAKGMKYNEALKSSECKNRYKKQFFFYYYIICNYDIIMSISSTGIYGSTTHLNSDLFTDLFQDVDDIKQDIEDISVNKIPADTCVI